MASTMVAPRMRRRRTSAFPERRRFTVDEYERMMRAGIVREGERVELVEGEIFQMAAMGSQHAACINELLEWFLSRLMGRAIVTSQTPLHIPSVSEPEPDLMLLRYRADRYRDALPRPEDVLLAIEISDTTFRFDRDRKLPMYAAAGIPEAWLVDLPRKRTLVQREPREGRYEQIATVTRDGSLSPLAFPELSLPMAQILGRS